jgi:hypothetical protein
VRQQSGVAREACHAEIGMLKYDQVELAAAVRNLSSNLSDSERLRI